MRNTILVVAALMIGVGCWTSGAWGQEADKDKTITELRQRVAELEAQLAQAQKRIEELSAKPGDADAQREALKAAARQRAQRDRQKYTAAQIREAEELYQVANKNWRTPEARQSLEKMVEKFPQMNRTGCAMLYLAQMSEGEEKEKRLKDVVEKFSDCYYFNGVQVGGFARLLLGLHYQETGNPEKAKAVFDEIRKDYPNAIDHRGNKIVAQIPEK